MCSIAGCSTGNPVWRGVAARAPRGNGRHTPQSHHTDRDIGQIAHSSAPQTASSDLADALSVSLSLWQSDHPPPQAASGPSRASEPERRPHRPDRDRPPRFTSADSAAPSACRTAGRSIPCIASRTPSATVSTHVGIRAKRKPASTPTPSSLQSSNWCAPNFLLTLRMLG